MLVRMCSSAPVDSFIDMSISGYVATYLDITSFTKTGTYVTAPVASIPVIRPP